MNKASNLPNIETHSTAQEFVYSIRRVEKSDFERLTSFFEDNNRLEITWQFHPFPLTRVSVQEIVINAHLDEYFIAVSDIGEAIGFGMLRGWEEGFEIPSFGLLVSAAACGRGVGRELTSYAFQIAQLHACNFIRLSVYSDNTKALKLYREVGFYEIERRNIQFFGKDREKIIMLKQLDVDKNTSKTAGSEQTVNRIPVAEPALVGNEKAYVLDCLESTWISSNGKYIEAFEKGFAHFCQTEFAISCCNGTVALHLALLASGVRPGDEVIVPTLTYVATANAVTYCGACPVFIDSEPETWNINPYLIESKISPRTKGIIVVHLYGHPVDMDPVLEVARKYGLFIIEDAAEAHGAEYKGRKVGSFGDIATFSFYGNKIITTGEGGMLTTNNKRLAARIQLLKGQGVDPERRYWFPMVGYNYRMTNIQAAIGLAQLEKIDWHLRRRRENAAWYREELDDGNCFILQDEKSWARNVYWMNCVVFGENISLSRDEIMLALARRGIETRPFFYPMHVLPMYRRQVAGQGFPVADWLAGRGVNLPSSAALTYKDVKFVCDSLKAVIG